MHSSDFVNACRDVVKTSELITSYLKDCMKEILLDTTNNAYSLEKDDNETIVTSLSDIHAILPKEVKSDFNRLTNNGNINITCTI